MNWLKKLFKSHSDRIERTVPHSFFLSDIQGLRHRQKAHYHSPVKLRYFTKLGELYEGKFYHFYGWYGELDLVRDPTFPVRKLKRENRPITVSHVSAVEYSWFKILPGYNKVRIPFNRSY